MLRALFGGTAAVALILSAGLASAQDFSAERISDGIRHISADEFQGRYPGTEGERMTLAWLQAQYEEMGLEPGGPNGQWLQDIVLKRFTPIEGAASASWTGPDGAAHPLVVGTDILVRASNDEGVAAVENAGVVFVGHGIYAPERGWDDYGDVDVRGKIVVTISGEPKGEAVTERFNGEYPTAYNSGAYKADEAFRRGAIGLISLTPAEATDQDWQRQVGASNRQRTRTPGAASLQLNGAVRYQTLAAMATAAGVDPAIFAEVGTGTFKAVPLEGVSMTIAQRESLDTLTTHNLLARIPGSTRPNETIIYSAHWDHVGVTDLHAGPTATVDNIFNGAWDNASGTIGVLEMARQIKAAPQPERTIVFAHMAAEEMGLLGSYAYTANPVYPLETTVADINIDMLPLSGPTRDLAIFGKGQNSLEDDLEVLAAAEGRVVTDDREPDQGYYYRSDHFPFARAGVPALMPWHGVDLDEGGVAVGQPAYTAYFSAHYHRSSDEWSADWDLRSAVENLTLLYRLGLQLANSDAWPTWKPTSEFGAIRATTDAARQ